MLAETVMVACRRPVQRLLDGVYVRTGVPFHAVAPWAYRAALATTFAEGGLNLAHLWRMPDARDPASVLAAFVIPVCLVGAYSYLGRKAASFSRAARRDPWLWADPTYRVAPSVGLVSSLFFMLVVFTLIPIPSLVRIAAFAYANPWVLGRTWLAEWAALLACSSVAALVAMVAILVAGCERCRGARRPGRTRAAAPQPRQEAGA